MCGRAKVVSFEYKWFGEFLNLDDPCGHKVVKVSIRQVLWLKSEQTKNKAADTFNFFVAKYFIFLNI